MITYNNIVSDIKNFFDHHLQVSQFLHLQTWDVEARENTYVTVILVPQMSTVNGSQLNLNFNLFVADILNSDETNQRDVYSDTLDICRDFLAYFQGNPCIEWEIGEDTTITPFNEKPFDDILSGWILNFTVQMPFDRNQCDIPLDADSIPLNELT